MSILSRQPLTLARTEYALRTHCPYCAFQCGMILGDGDGRPEQVAGDPHFPVNNGQMCIKGWSSHTLLRHPRRLTKPLIRDKITDEYREADWDEALDLIADKLRTIRAESGANAVGAFGSGALTNEKAYLLGKFARLALGTAHIDYNGRYCMSSAAAGQNRAFGIDRGLPFPVADIERAEVIFLAGANVADTLPPIMQWFERQKKAGGRLIVSDPRRTMTARAADLFLQLTPGTDLALANGMLAVAIEEGLVDKSYVAERTIGFEAIRAIALQYHPARVERLTGIPEAQIRTAARWLATAKSAMILSARGAEQHSKGVDTVHSLINLALALGKVGKSYSGYGCLTGQGNGQGGREHGQKADQLPGYRLIEVDAHRAAVAKVWGVDPNVLPRKGRSAFELLDSLGPDGIRALVVMGSNVAVASPDADRIEKRLKALDFLVVLDAFHNETTAQAHVVLPVYQWAEEEGTLTNLEGRVIRRRVIARPPNGVRGDIDILRDLAARLGVGDKFDFYSPREVFDEFRRATAGGLADYSGITYEKIDANDGVFWPCPARSNVGPDAAPDSSDGEVYDHPGTPRLFADRFYHPDGRAKFFPVEHRAAGEEPDATFPISVVQNWRWS
ncbi:molybdopterin oxidoreductase family protein [Fimbriiglobus ruber]|uniref:Assimilatory nitrate reductase large subunit n=1 Tax=Fimbriiglobus ruber TaxID=1908690 RepID=A0A225DYL9_9BACT|nr:molybdopterin-dependent oxidoreductase [Fimbriiglobus ruber]OWK46412.1 Assimilatory nitrate reductase large subunit [Fimbriiglobus ruber]